MPGGFVRLRERRQVTLPQEVVDELGLKLGDVMEFATTEKGTIELRPARIVTVGTPEAKQEEAVARQNIRQGRDSVVTNVDEFVDRVRKGDYPSDETSPNPFDEETAHDPSLLVDRSQRVVQGYVVRADPMFRLTPLRVMAKLINLSPLQETEVRKIAEETVKKYISAESTAGTIIPHRAENAAE
jgi:AbrB family looped-hinge helix DNA binding protein